MASGLDLPTDLAYAPDGRLFIAEKRGTIRVVAPTGELRVTPFITLDDEVNNAGDRGLLSIAVDPAFSTNGYVYLLYSVDPEYGGPEESADEPTFSRLTRYTASASSGQYQADLSSRFVLIGETPAEGIPACYNTHANGAVRFAVDGTLFVSAGDGASKNYVDYGQNEGSYSHLCEDIFGAEEDIGALRAQSLTSKAGKILRIDATTGLGVTTNPYYTGNPADDASMVWALGFRQPFHFTVREGSPGPGVIYMGDVGSSYYEEVNLVQQGFNGGWPCYEGNSLLYLYTENPETSEACAEVTWSDVNFPVIAWSHNDPAVAGFTGSASIGGVFYTGSRWPSMYRGAYFFMDYTEGWIRSMVVSEDDEPGAITLFASGLDAPVSLTHDPLTGNLVYASIAANEIRMIHFQQEEHTPQAVAVASPMEGPAPLTVTFDASGSSDADGDALSYAWTLGDGAGSSARTFTHTYTVAGTYVVALVVSDPTGRSNSASVTIGVDNTTPQAIIMSPEDGSLFTVPSRVMLEGEGIDAEQELFPDSAFEWVVDLHHGTHVHYDWMLASGPTTELLIDAHGENDIYYEITLSVTDEGGLSGSDTVFVFPDGDLDTDGDGLTNEEEGTLGTDPYQVDSDGDTLSDGEEVLTFGTDPLHSDTDGDGLSDDQELNVYHTSPILFDTDGDSYSDGEEVDYGSDPNDHDDHPSTGCGGSDSRTSPGCGMGLLGVWALIRGHRRRVRSPVSLERISSAGSEGL